MNPISQFADLMVVVPPVPGGRDSNAEIFEGALTLQASQRNSHFPDRSQDENQDDENCVDDEEVQLPKKPRFNERE